MSNLFNTHAVINYTSGKTKPLEGQRLAKITYKVDKATGVKPASKAVSIPVISFAMIEPHLASLKDEIVALVHKAQDGLIRSKVEAGASEVQEQDCNMQATIAYMLEESGRLTGDTIREWFNEALRDNLMMVVADKLGIGDTPTKEQSDKLAKYIKGYEDTFAKLASGAASFTDMQKQNMLKALELVDDEEDSLKARFTVRLQKAKEKDEELLLAL